MNRYIFDIRLKYRAIRHFVLFVTTVLLFSFVLFFQEESKSFKDALVVTLTNSVFFYGYAYIVLFLLIPEFLLKNKISWFLLLFLLVGTALSAFKFAVSDEIFYASIAPENFQPGSIKGLRFMLVNTKDMTFIVALFCVAKFTKDYVYTERQRQKLEIQNREARQRLLQSQLNPHFLFNTINNLYALSLLQPEKTAEITERVQRILRYIVEQSRHNFVKLTEEVALVENFLSLEKLRYGDRLKTEIFKKGDLSTWKIPPMVLFFLIENSIKHGSSPDIDKPWLFISIESQPGNLRIKASNSKPDNGRQYKVEAGNGNGLQNLENRLAILYPQKGYSIQIDDREKEFTILVQLKKEFNEMVPKSYR